MKKSIVTLGLIGLSSPAFSQWAVLDEEARKLLFKINEVTAISFDKLEDVKFNEQKKLSEKFESISASNPEKYIGSAADCGDRKLNEVHFNACMGLRNLRLISLQQTEEIIVRLEKRRKNISDLIVKSTTGSAAEKEGQLQRYQFELQGMQAQMQNDATQLEALRYGYKQREHMYEMQMAEARRATDTRPPSGEEETIGLGVAAHAMNSGIHCQALV
jgi:hypothetical protein